MSTRENEQATADSTHPPQPASQRKRSSLAGIGDKASGLVNIIHGTGEVIRGHAIETGDFGRGHGKGKAIAAAGREEVERGLNKIEGTHARTSAVTDAPNGGGPHDGTLAGAAPVGDPNAPHASAAAPRADPSAGKGKARWDAPDTNGYPSVADKETRTGTAGAAGGGAVGDPGTDLRTNEQIATPAPGARPARGARPAGTDSDDPNVQHDTGVLEPRPAPGDTGKQVGPTADLPLSGETAGHPEDQSSGTAARMGQRSDRPADAGLRW